MAEFPALPLWTDAYLADTAHLSYEEHGLYFHLLMTMWRSPMCQIPNDDDWINRRFDGNAIALRRLCEEFCTVTEDGKWLHQKRLRKQWNWCREKSQKGSENANHRWNKEKEPSNGNANAMPTQSNGNASKSISKSKSSLEGNGMIEGRKWVLTTDQRWAPCEARYREEKGISPKIDSRSNQEGSWFPASWAP